MPTGQAIVDTRKTAAERIRGAQRLVKYRRGEALGMLNEIFRAGRLPDTPLDGRYSGALIALDVAPGLTQLSQLIAQAWMPWQGKTFDAARSRGDNIFTRDSLALAHIWWPLYCRYLDDGPNTYRAFAFRTYLGPGRSDPDRQVLKIDYDIVDNPQLSVRHVLDELVQIADGLYLGKAHLRWWWGAWQLVAYFTLEP